MSGMQKNDARCFFSQHLNAPDRLWAPWETWGQGKMASIHSVVKSFWIKSCQAECCGSRPPTSSAANPLFHSQWPAEICIISARDVSIGIAKQKERTCHM